MNRDELRQALEKAVVSKLADRRKALSDEARAYLNEVIRTGVSRVFNEKTFPDTDKIQRDFSSELDRFLSENVDAIVYEKGLRDWIAKLCPGFYPFC